MSFHTASRARELQTMAHPPAWVSTDNPTLRRAWR
jgi:hypothetical protein